MLNKLFVLITSLLIFILVGCKDNDGTTSNNYPKLSFGPSNNLTYDDILNYYSAGIDSNDIVGEIYIQNTNVSILNNVFSLVQSNANNARISIFGDNDTVYRTNNSYLNQQIFNEEYSGAFWARGDAMTAQGLQLLFGSVNYFQIEATPISSQIDTVISFFDAPAFTVLQTGDSISKSTDFNLQWSGTSTRYLHVSLTQAFPDGNHTSLISESCFLDNNGSYIFPAGQLSEFPNGMYNLTITNFKPYFLYDNNGKIILTIVKSQNTKTVFIKD